MAVHSDIPQSIAQLYHTPQPFGAHPAWQHIQDKRSYEAVNVMAGLLERHPTDEATILLAALSLQHARNYATSRTVLAPILKKDHSCAKELYIEALLSEGHWREAARLAGAGTLPANIEELSGKPLLFDARRDVSTVLFYSRFFRDLKFINPRSAGVICQPEMVDMLRTIRQLTRVNIDIAVFDQDAILLPIETLPLLSGRSLSELNPERPDRPCFAPSRQRSAINRARFEGKGPTLGMNWRDAEGRSPLNPTQLEQLFARACQLGYHPVITLPELTPTEEAICNRYQASRTPWSDLNSTSRLRDWIASLDSLITVDGPQAHLASILSKPCHLLLDYSASGRWSKPIRDAIHPHCTIHRPKVERDEEQWFLSLLADLPPASKTMEMAAR